MGMSNLLGWKLGWMEPQFGGKAIDPPRDEKPPYTRSKREGIFSTRITDHTKEGFQQQITLDSQEIINMNYITTGLFKEVMEVVHDVCNTALDNPKLILTEADIQSHLFASLLNLRQVTDGNVSVHSELNFLKDERTLGHKPDLILLQKNEFCIDSEGELIDRKGYTIWGSSIALELKFFRESSTLYYLRSVITDIEKLANIKEQHYTEQDYYFFGASVLLCRRTPPANVLSEINQKSIEKNIPFKIYNHSGQSTN